MADRDLMMSALPARLHDLARRTGVAGFWQWWTRQLDVLVPAAPRAALERRRMRPVLVFDGDHATLWRPALAEGRARMTQAAQIPLAGDAAELTAAGRAALAGLAKMVYGGPAGRGRIVVSIPARDVLRKRIALPAAIEEGFKQALSYDLDRHTPFKADELYFDAAIVDRNPARGMITVDLAAARRAVVDPALRHVAAWGGEVAAVVPEPPETAATSRLNLLPAELRTVKSIWTRWQFWLPLGLLFVLALAAVAIPLWQKREYAKELRELADQARARAAVSETLRTELDSRVADYNTAIERKFAFPSALAVVGAISKVMPDDTWLTQFDLKTVAKGKETQREFLVRGETANAGRLVQLLEESPLFTQAAQRGPTTKIQPGPGEIFDLGAQLKPQPLPERLALTVTEKPAEGAAAAPDAPNAGAAASSSAAPAPVPSATTTAPMSAVPVPAPPAATAPAPAAGAPGASPGPAAMPAPSGPPAGAVRPRAEAAPPAPAAAAPPAPPADAGKSAGGSGRKS